MGGRKGRREGGRVGEREGGREGGKEGKREIKNWDKYIVVMQLNPTIVSSHYSPSHGYSIMYVISCLSLCRSNRVVVITKCFIPCASC